MHERCSSSQQLLGAGTAAAAAAAPDVHRRGCMRVQALAQSAPDYIRYLYCGQPYAYEYGINSQLLEDGIHPTVPGLELLAACIQKDVDVDMKYSSS